VHCVVTRTSLCTHAYRAVGNVYVVPETDTDIIGLGNSLCIRETRGHQKKPANCGPSAELWEISARGRERGGD